jgi:hypothetical protein
MNPELAKVLVPIFLPLWAVLAVGSTAFLFLSRDAKLKRQVLAPFVIGSGVLFVAFVSLFMPLIGLPFFALFVGLISWLNLRTIKFCDGCGRTLLGHNPIAPPKYCSACGAQLGS